jgi:glycosyltransferase involved in cell wall biosynthesis
VKISAILTNYNQGRFVKTSLESLLKQSLLPDEIIIVDDKSTDDSVDIIKKEIKNLTPFFGPTKVKLIERETNGLPAGARNSGIRAMAEDTDVVCFLDADDWYEREKIRESVIILSTYPDIGLVYTDYYMLDTKSGQRRLEPKFAYNVPAIWQSCIVSTNSILRASVVREIGFFDERKDLNGVFEDYNYWLRISKRYPMYHIAEPLFTYRIHGNNITLKNAPSVMHKLQAMVQETYNNG